MAKYIPPIQSKVSQIIDVIVLLVLAIGALYMPLFLNLAGSAQTSSMPEDITWESLGQNATMVEKWNDLGFANAADAAELITSRFDYSFSILSLLVMIVVVVGYYAIVLRFSGKEYREVINEKFGEK
jgi:Ca2+/H+ antiporter